MRAKIQRYFEFVLSGAVIGTRSCGFGCRLCGFQQLWHEDPQAGSGKTARAKILLSRTRRKPPPASKWRNTMQALGRAPRSFNRPGCLRTKFITSGWQFGGQATAAAKTGDRVAQTKVPLRWDLASGFISSSIKILLPSSPPKGRNTMPTTN